MKTGFAALGGFLLAAVIACGITFYEAPLRVNDWRIRMHLRQQHVLSEYAEVDGYRIHYFEAQIPFTRHHGPNVPLVLIHGLGSRGEDWSGLIPTLAAKGFHVYALDLLGYGRSPKPDIQYTVSEQEKLVADFMDAVGVPHADVIGWSMGGWVALKLTLDHPEKVDRLVVYDSAGVYFPKTFDASLFTPNDIAGLDKLTGMLSPRPHGELPKFVSRDAIETLQANAWVIDRSVASMLSGHDLLDFRLHRITQPTLIVWGGADQLIPLSAGVEMHQKIAGSSMLVVDGCGHLAPQECARPVLKGTVDFLRANPPLVGVEREVAGTQK